MKYIEVDEELYRHIASKTEQIGESASDILRRILGLQVNSVVEDAPEEISHPSLEVESKPEKVVQKPAAKLAKLAKPVSNFSTLIDAELLANQKGAVGRFLFILDTVYLASPKQFEQVLQIQGRDRLYFATSKDALLKASKSANPKEIGQSGFWVTTNNNTAKKRTILSEVLMQFGTDEAQISEIAAKI
ncbi:replication initiation negative regulator SeqA [Shewanella fidelis]|uniref:Negative modulator of initiation of replication n=1 Tax=Shewanella fidelis TaxID=173509 RepID=A0AAW8NKW3_9GAMM|nr:replication initiation negative regulator SeqA [Shewanella fidelis]MDR8523898.1 replication initiation negative regulator SeqA [Shewanella fidelis]MDW4810445.1 replication initiation negative regulator SeqA [Shewanella fidelis]MDW4814566.1 replication initiation negative regulator SeqA [Shewanella fidelis]MDW4818656.1 replication initiation negative regulator SeqA [Shewanella fidelis]MDW4823667.1 replication initiation negative regulator SeqA [Shewanella fidelis]